MKFLTKLLTIISFIGVMSFAFAGGVGGDGGIGGGGAGGGEGGVGVDYRDDMPTGQPVAARPTSNICSLIGC